MSLHHVRNAWNTVREFARTDKKRVALLAVGIGMLLIWGLSKAGDHRRKVASVEPTGAFQTTRILSSSVLDSGKETWLSKKAGELLQSQQALKTDVVVIQEKLNAIEQKLNPPSPTPTSQSPAVPDEPIRVHSGASFASETPSRGSRSFSSPRIRSGGPSVISFPVEEASKSELSVVLPAGSYVKAKLLTGVEAPEGKTYPVLAQLDYAYIVPNHHRLDLSGCFMIVKATGNLSIERVEMQATKLSCVAKDGQMFEREVSAFIADDKDQSFAVLGKVNSKQDRVASVAFLASLVEGIGKAIQQAQTTQQTTPLGGSQSVLTGDDAKYMGAGSAASAAGMVAQWYLRQAQNLLPTINVGSGRDIWVVMQESVTLPTPYFQKNKRGDKKDEVSTYFTRLLD